MEPNGGAGKSWQYKQQVRFAGRIYRTLFFLRQTGAPSSSNQFNTP